MKWFKNGILTAALLGSAFTYAKTLDSIIAVVNDDVVTQLELLSRVAMIKDQYKANPSVLPNDAVLNKQILDALILESLQLQLAERGNLQIPESQIDEALNRLAKRQNMTLNQFMAAVQNSGTDLTRFRNQIANELTINELQKQVIGRQVYVSDSEVERFLTSQSGQSLKDTEYQLAYLRFEAGNRSEAESLVEKLNEGSELLNTESSRDLGMRKLSEIPSLFRTLVPVLKLNEAVLLERDDKLHIAQLIDKTEVKSINVEEFHIRHILIKTDELFDDQSAKSLLADIKSQIENGASMEDLADEYSQDNGTRGRGGDLDWNTLDNYVTEFGDVARALNINQVSEPFLSPFGYHILRVEGTRNTDVGLDVLKKQIRNQIYQRRFSESLQRWLTELRAESYVEFRQP